MVNVKQEISKELYEKGKKEGPDSLIPEYMFCSYGVYGSYVIEDNGKYYLQYWRGDSCD